MRILTVRQPWAWAIIHGGKNVENRVRNIAGSYRGPVAIHVAGKYAVDGLDLPALDEACDEWCAVNGCGDHPWFRGVGAIIGVIDLVGAHICKSHSGEMNMPVCFDSGTPYAMTCSPWAEFIPGQVTHHLVLAKPRPLAEPVPFTGALGLRTLPDDVAALVLSRVVS